MSPSPEAIVHDFDVRRAESKQSDRVRVVRLIADRATDLAACALATAVAYWFFESTLVVVCMSILLPLWMGNRWARRLSNSSAARAIALTGPAISTMALPLNPMLSSDSFTARSSLVAHL